MRTYVNCFCTLCCCWLQQRRSEHSEMTFIITSWTKVWECWTYSLQTLSSDIIWPNFKVKLEKDTVVRTSLQQRKLRTSSRKWCLRYHICVCLPILCQYSCSNWLNNEVGTNATPLDNSSSNYFSICCPRKYKYGGVRTSTFYIILNFVDTPYINIPTISKLLLLPDTLNGGIRHISTTYYRSTSIMLNNIGIFLCSTILSNILFYVICANGNGNTECAYKQCNMRLIFILKSFANLRSSC
jgi:hypothetical protein